MTDLKPKIHRLHRRGLFSGPRDALIPSMPRNAQSAVQVDYSVPIAEMAPLLARLVQQTVPEENT